MDLDEIIFTRFTKYFKKRSIANDPLAARRVMLDDIKPKLTIMSRALTGKNIEIFAAEQEGGYRDNNFFLPHSMDFFGDATENLKFYFFRIVYLVIQQNKNLNWQHDQKENTLQEARLKAASSAPEILDLMLSAYPNVIGIYKQLYDQLAENFKNTKADPDTFWLYGKWMKNQYEDNFNEKIKNISEAKPLEKNKVNPATLLKAKAIEEIKSIQVDKKQQEDYVLTHNFEKVETAEEFNGTWRDFDGDDQLEDHHEAIEELSMKLTVRVDDPVHSVYQAEFIENSSVAESVDKPDERYNILYPEWDYTRKSYKQDFCAVYPTLSKDMNANYYEQTIRNYKSVLLAMRKLLTNYSNKRKHIRSQPDGPEFDIDAITDLYVDVHSGKTPSERIYLSSQKKDKDLSILLLLDTSLSSDGYADGNRVIDVEKQVSLLFGEILNEFRVDFAVSDFHSSTRNFLSFRMLKDFDESWQSGKFKIGAAEPSGYTRIGGALRHATHLLKNRHTTNKWVILLSDGKPNDYDKYEGRYGIQDVRQALREALEYGINSYALAIEAQARFYYQILEGNVKMCSYNDEGRTFIQGMFGPGDSFGDPPLFLNEAYPACAQAESDCIIFKLSKDTLLKLLEEYQELQMRFIINFAGRIFEKTATNKNIVSPYPEERILGLLKRFKKQKSVKQERILIPYTRQQIADFLGLRVETVIRTLIKMEEEMKVEIRHHKLYY